MRISRIQLAGLAVAIAGAGGAAQEAAADDLTITTATTTPVVTSNAANASPGDVTIASTGSITIDAGETAVTIDSNNDVTNSGRIASNNADDVIAIWANGGFSGTITNNGAVNLFEDNTISDTDSDGDLDGVLAVGTNRHGIFINGAFTGDIINSASGDITVEGNNSSAITLNGPLTGNITNDGDIGISGGNSYGILIDGAVSGDVISTGTIGVRGENSSAIRVNEQIGGELSINGIYTVSGYLSNQLPSNQATLEPSDVLQSGAAIDVRASVDGGVTIEGLGVEDDEDDDGDSTNDEADDNDTAQILVFGSSPAVLLRADAGNILLGQNEFGFGLHNRGVLTTNGLYDGISSTGFRVEGLAGNTVTVSGGITNDRAINSIAREANAYVISIGDGAIVSQILNRDRLLSNVVSDGADTAYGVYLEGGATSSLVNGGTISAELLGEQGDAVAIFDGSNSLASITNRGTIRARVAPTDDDPSDEIVPVATGDEVAIDVSASTINVLIEQLPDVPFTDDDAVDDDEDNRPLTQIVGDVRFGSGSDTFNLLAGSVTGDMSFGAGADTFLIDNGASFVGRLGDSDGALSLTVNEGTLDILGGDVNGEVNITTATFGADSVLRLRVDPVDAASTLIQATGSVTFAAGASVIPVVPEGLPETDDILFLTANQLFGGANVAGTSIAGDGVPFVYDLAIELVNPLAADGAANGLIASYDLKNAAQLGLNSNEAIAFDPIIDALRLDSGASAAFTSLANQAEFDDAYEDLMPSYSSAAAELAATAIQQAQGASSNRLAAVRLQGLDEVSAWAQEIGYFVRREPPSLNGQEFEGYGFGLAVGIDGPLNNGALFGLSASLIASEVEEEGRPDGEIAATLGQLSAYLGTAVGPIDLDFVAGAGAGQMSSQRVVEIGDTFSAESEAEWWAYEGHGLMRASVPLALGNSIVITPQAQLTYVFLSEDGYTEAGGGAAIDYEVDATTSQRLWGDVGVELAARFRSRGQTVIAPRLFVGYRANIIDDEAERTFRFVSGTDSFTLTDDGIGDGGALVGIGLDATNGYSTLSFGYEGEYGDHIERHSINASVRFRF